MGQSYPKIWKYTRGPEDQSHWDPILAFTCLPKPLLWILDFLTKNNPSAFSIPIVVNVIKMKSNVPWEIIPPLLTPYHCVKFMNACKAEPALLSGTLLPRIWKLQSVSLFPTLQPHPVAQPVLTCKQERNIRQVDLLRSVDAYLCIPGPSVPRESWVLGQHC